MTHCTRRSASRNAWHSRERQMQAMCSASLATCVPPASKAAPSGEASVPIAGLMLAAHMRMQEEHQKAIPLKRA